MVDEQNLADWRKGIKQTEVIMPLLQGSDAHPTVDHKARSTWIYLPEVSPQCLRHAFATHEASISQEQQPPIEPDFWIKSIRFEGGQYDGRRINFSPRANALIGPPSSGKSLIVDAIRWAFDLPCAINDVQSSIDRRLTKCLPDGTTVVVELEGGDNNHELRRVRGGTNAPDTEVKPIVFSQAELSRRSMEPIPSVALLDIHCPQGEVHKQGIAEVSDKVHSAFLKIVALATQARAIRLKVGNEQEGLEATRSKYFNLVGDEDTARSLGDLGRIETWHKVARERLVSCIQSSLAKVGDVGQDLVGGLGPDKRFGVFVGDVQVAVDGSLQFGSALMHAAAQLLFGEQTEPALHQVQPRGAGGCEVHMEAGPLGKPVPDQRRLVGGVVVRDQVDVGIKLRGSV